MSYRICPYCKAFLDPGELCDCPEAAAHREPARESQKNTAPVYQHRGGKVEKVATDRISTPILQNR